MYLISIFGACPMIIGVSSILLFHQRTTSNLIRYLNELELNYLDLFLIPPYLSTRNINSVVSEIRASIHDVKFTIRAPSFSENLASILSSIRDVTLREYIETIEIAHKLSFIGVIIKPGMMFHIEKKFKEDIMNIFENNLRRLAELAYQRELKLFIENYYYPYEILRRAESFSSIYEIIDDYTNVNFALNIPHLLESKSSVHFLIKNCDSKILNRIKLVYLGLRPSPWEKSEYIQSITHSYYEFLKLKEVVKPEYVVAASIDPIVTKILVDYLKGLE